MSNNGNSGTVQPVGDNRPYRVSFNFAEGDLTQAVYFLYYDESGGAFSKDTILHDDSGRLLFTDDAEKLPSLLRHGKEEFLAFCPPRDEPVVEHAVWWTVRILSGTEPVDREDEAYCTLTMLCDCLVTIDPDDGLGFRKVLGRIHILNATPSLFGRDLWLSPFPVRVVRRPSPSAEGGGRLGRGKGGLLILFEGSELRKEEGIGNRSVDCLCEKKQ